MTTPVEWLTAILDEDQCVAEAAHGKPWQWNYLNDFNGDVPPWAELMSGDDVVIACEGQLVMFGTADAEHIALHDPAAVLALVAAHRAILFYHSGSHECSGPDDNCMWIEDEVCPTVRVLASAFAHRPGFKEEWRP